MRLRIHSRCERTVSRRMNSAPLIGYTVEKRWRRICSPHRGRLMFGDEERPMWRCLWQIVDEGPHFGLRLYGWFNIPPEGKRVTPSFGMAAAWTVSIGTRAPSGLRRHKPSYFLGDCQFLAVVRTVDRDRNHVKRPEKASYSRVDYLKERVQGTPPSVITSIRPYVITRNPAI